MRLILSTLLVLALATASRSQDYLPLLQPDAVWSVLHQEPSSFWARDTFTEHYRIGSDTLHDGLIWKKLYYSTAPVFSWDDPDLQLAGFIREEDQRVYYAGGFIRYHEIDDPIYDFTLEVGDVFHKSLDDTGQPQHLVVHAIDTVRLLDDLPRRRFHLGIYYPIEDRWQAYDYCIWIEGMGEQNNGLLPQYLPPYLGADTRTLDKLLCYQRQEELIFQSSVLDGCHYEYAYERFINSSKIWAVQHEEVIFTGPDSYVIDTLTEHYWISTVEPVLVEGQLGFPVFINYDSAFNYFSPDNQQIGIIWEEDRRVYYRGRYYYDSLLYDFNLLPGDTILEYNTDVGEPIIQVVTEVDTLVLADGIPRKRLYTGYWFRGHGSESDEFFPSDIIWVEGIGDITHGLLPQHGLMLPNLRHRDALLCMKENDGIVYQNPDFTACFIERLTSPVREIPQLPLAIAPNPVSDRLHLRQLDQLPPGELLISDVWGRNYYRQSCRPACPDLSIDVGDWPAGLYLIRYTSGGARYQAKRLIKLGTKN
ncbi:T9SS type A sorting domain-containing protein [Flavilitoribacter nigricans]|uniref:T9SS type A sorting domain-containing protein n=1 Tax=Flavilitoribacter nigricans (strain ATCC 23147 / DSM 23189 / NBRC 102662 / NCIMB 1420 / SS-2) TaxID=1122177 RepID=A0A2D0NIG8_FLAN2|nr:T9SS type A sorting domain-containing protein [Flavilitoribacter nigricans]PHN08291.1 hypothetical protein CRP01_02925 [Flavilitoribacter nigricans DSM 23189 = NBRC 102662]